MPGTNESLFNSPDPQLINALEEIFAGSDAFSDATHNASDPPSGGSLALLERPEDLDTSTLNLEDLVREETTAEAEMPEVVLAAQAAHFVDIRTRVNRMLLHLAKTDDLDAAMCHYRCLIEGDIAEQEVTRRAYQANPEMVRLNDKEYTDLFTKYIQSK